MPELEGSSRTDNPPALAIEQLWQIKLPMIGKKQIPSKYWMNSIFRNATGDLFQRYLLVYSLFARYALFFLGLPSNVSLFRTAVPQKRSLWLFQSFPPRWVLPKIPPFPAPNL